MFLQKMYIFDWLSNLAISPIFCRKVHSLLYEEEKTSKPVQVRVVSCSKQYGRSAYLDGSAFF